MAQLSLQQCHKDGIHYASAAFTTQKLYGLADLTTNTGNVALKKICLKTQ